jgi:uncharacterized protein (TIGR03382 family)
MNAARRMSFVCSILTGVLLGLATADGWALGTNVIANGDAEAGPGSADGFAAVVVPSWSASATFIAIQYGAPGGFPLSTDPGPPARGSNFFAGGNASALTTVTQLANLSADAAPIDTGTVTYALSGYLGGFSSQDDNATLTVAFQNAASTTLGTATIGPVTAADRGSATGMLLRTAAGTVPAGTRQALITLTLTRVSGTYNDGYADNLSLVLSGGAQTATPVPATGPAALALLSLLLVLSVRRRRVRRD